MTDDQIQKMATALVKRLNALDDARWHRQIHEALRAMPVRC